MDLNPLNQLVNPLGHNPADRAQQLATQAGGPAPGTLGAMDPSFARTLSQVQQTGEKPSESGSKENSERLMEVSRQFEGLLIHQMLKSMRDTVNKTGLLDGFAGGQFEAMLDEELSKEVVKHQSIGMAQTIYDQMSRHLPPAAQTK